ncbi:pseudouridine synthase [Chitinophagales bacterium]|nr:pseudouridine synthase [Chitinophagales bacterium]
MKNHRHFIIHKPLRFLSQFVTNQTVRKNKGLLGELHDFPEGTMAIGRLDADSEGLLLLSTDGKVSEQIRSKNIEKEYYAQVDGAISDEAISQLNSGVLIRIDGADYRTLPSKATRLDIPPNFPPRAKKIRGEHHGPTSWVSITISEGKFRQVRKMTAVVGFATLRLVRVRIGSILLNDMPAGKVVEVEELGVL